jgi:hypothetical protein
MAQVTPKVQVTPMAQVTPLSQVTPMAQTLTYAGALPFLICALALFGGRVGAFDPVAVLKIYSLTIAAFMAGTQWGYVVSNARARYGAVVLVFSNAVALTVAGAALIPSPRLALGVDLAAFLALLGADGFAGRLGWIAPAYLALRLRVTALVVAALLVAEVAL